ncbi:hypothetical protein [Xylanimonas protaetiae]|uniref:Uncharacterized protein n=1 Tax=Xylanimonas protaetiae TaxID=2509457 RepID=A0A4P6F982_9MICO|nr:hypothetical protein [Xylanimonas protaetiae]QAY70829.1 hypothetical protein ET471_13020 [Xylanimonas protaetiae]
MNAPDPDGVDRRPVLVGLAVAVVAGLGGFAGFTAVGPTPGDDGGRDGDDGHDDDGGREDDDRRDERGDDRSGPDRGKG